MKLAIMQPYFFPYIGYYQAIHAVDKYILYDKLNYIYQGWMNRNRILILSGIPTYISVRLKNGSPNNRIDEIIVDDTFPWRKKTLNSIFYNYKKAPYFDEIFTLIEEIIYTESELLRDINNMSVKKIASYLEIPTEIVTDCSIYEDLEKRLDDDKYLTNLYKTYKLPKLDKKILRAFELTKMNSADTLVNAIGGQLLYRKEDFENNGFKLFFVKTLGYEYEQRNIDFLNGLSIIDILMNCGKAVAMKILNSYELI